MSWGTVAITEIIWTLCGVVGLSFSHKNLKEIRLSQRALYRLNGNKIESIHILKIIAFGHYRNEMFRVGKASLIVISGVCAMIIPPANPDVPVSPLQIIILCAVFGIALQIVMASALDARQREILRELSVESTPPSAAHSEGEPPTT